MALIDKLAWIHIESQKVLMVRSHGKDKFYLPGGKRDPGETDLQALLREVSEELLVSLDPESVRYFQTFEAEADGKADSDIVRLTCYQAEYSGELQIASEIAEMRWLGRGDLSLCSVASEKVFRALITLDMI